MAKRLGFGIELVQVTAKTRIPSLESGKIDVIAAALTHTRERDKVIDFTISYVLDGQKLMVPKGSPIAARTTSPARPSPLSKGLITRQRSGNSRRGRACSSSKSTRRRSLP